MLTFVCGNCRTGHHAACRNCRIGGHGWCDCQHRVSPEPAPAPKPAGDAS